MSGCAHQISTYTHTLSDGTEIKVVYCVKCGMEWM